MANNTEITVREYTYSPACQKWRSERHTASRAKWAANIEEMNRLGMTRKKYAEMRGCSVATVQRWVHILRYEAAGDLIVNRGKKTPGMIDDTLAAKLSEHREEISILKGQNWIMLRRADVNVVLPTDAPAEVVNAAMHALFDME